MAGRKGIPRTRPLEIRFWEKVERGPVCWLWTARVDVHGYGRIHRGGPVTDMVPAHRISWELHFGPIPVGLFVCHNCPGSDNPRCVNPAHLFLGTQKDNMGDAKRKGRLSSGASHPTQRGVEHYNSKLNDIAVADIRRRARRRTRPSGPAKPGERWADLAREYGVAVQTIADVVRGKSWKTKPQSEIKEA